MPHISFGIDVFLKKYKPQQFKRLGLVTNDAVMTKQVVPVRKALTEAGFPIVRLFSPEHGIDAMGADGAAMKDKMDSLTGLPIHSLYSSKLKPPPSVLQDLDAVLFDLPDIGVRFYTYIWTLSHVMEACNDSQTPLIVLDRPNPLGSNLTWAEGPLLDESTVSSFIGRWRIPIRHSLTVGELAQFWKAERQLHHLDLTIVTVENGQRNLFFQDLNLPFIPTSPAISSVDTLLTYPALCFLEGLNVSEGRGTSFPFRVCGATWINGWQLAEAFNSLNLAGVKARAFSFTPSEGVYKNQLCFGIMLHIVDRIAFKPVSTGLYLVYLLRNLYPKHIQWANYPTLVNQTGARHFDLLTGTPELRFAMEHDGKIFAKSIENWTQTADWVEKVTPYLIYE
ncbi:MAG: DUF1343 domain-containing protein [Saprospiraceae bacterium]|nr:DUF1343 domain-containing protein [Saprospiraceae bacterium]